jgi:lipopolysaccharide/colanic/teichoic acid biosynthesis glycosyltransferase
MNKKYGFFCFILHPSSFLLPTRLKEDTVTLASDCRPREAAAPRATGGALGPPRTGRYAASKAAVDFILAALLLLPALPLIALATALVKLTSRGPAFYCQTRLGRGGRPFRIYKVRTMAHDCERLTGPRWATPGDPRVTPVGRLLRVTHLDELPQLFNVLRGEMSLVGPRPERPEFVAQLERAIPHYRERMAVRPGVTGLAQVQLPPDTDLAGVGQKLACDLYYVRRLSLWLDLRILLSTAAGVLGIPFAVPRLLLQIPSGEAVQCAYREFAAEARAAAAPRVQPA